MNQQFSLRWNNYLDEVTGAFGFLRNEEDLVDVTLSCEGKKIRAHKLLLSACSSYFRDIFKENPCQHPVIVFRNVKYEDLENLIEFMYKGEVNVLQEQLESFLGTAELLEVKGLTEGCGNENTWQEEAQPPIHKKRQSKSAPDPPKRDESTEIQSEPDVSYLPKASTPSSPLPKRRKYSKSSLPLKIDDKENTICESSNTSIVSKIVKEEIVEEQIVEDLTCDDDDEDDLPTSNEVVISASQSENINDFIARADPLDGIHNNANTDQIPVGEPHTLIEGASQKSPQAKENIIEENVTSDTKICNIAALFDIDKQSSTEGETKMETKVQKSNLEQSTEKCKLDESEKSKSVEEKENAKILNSARAYDTPPVMKSKALLQIPKGLTVTVSKVSKNKGQIEEVHIPELLPITDDTVLRSEEAKTPFQEEPESCEMYQTTETLDMQFDVNDSEMAAEAPAVPEEEQIEEEEEAIEEEKEPEFDYYGCENCKEEAKPVSDKFYFGHKCPICPCMCFCAHLLKEHMRFIHGWFNVKRSFKPR